MSYGCQKDFHIEQYVESFRHTSPVKRTWNRRSPQGSRYIEPDPLTKEQQDELLNVGALGLAGEGGEVIDLIKKHLFHGKPLDRDRAIEELGDVLWSVQCLAEALDVAISEVAQRNTEKLRRRYPNGFKRGGGIR
jgi:NTP pyrophosphatase (non-canonical NTP hydrolase)